MNRELELARRIIEETGTSLFLTGKAGTGKTTFLRDLVRTSPKRMIVLAPTGIAAINAGGMTIHSFFQLPFAPYVPGSAFKAGAQYRYSFTREKLKIIRSLDLLVIDEISMVRADLLDAVDDALRRARKSMNPFGGVQLLLIGDVHQLPPVTTSSDWEMLKEHYRSPYFFSSLALGKIPYRCIELQHIYRQQDCRFIEILNSIRDNRCTGEVLERLNSRYIPGFDPPDSEGYIRLFTHNRQAGELNSAKLEKIRKKEYTYTATVEGDFPESSYPAEYELHLKEGAQVMFIKNDISQDRAYVNGTIATISSIGEDKITVRTSGSQDDIEVMPAEWTNAKYVLNSSTSEIEEQIIGTFRQYPLRLAWGITIHKSQGLTFDKAIISANSAFSPGQIYVALSRCRTLEGLVLGERIPSQAIKSDFTVDRFSRNIVNSTPDMSEVSAMAREYMISCLDELFGFSEMTRAARVLCSAMEKNMSPGWDKQLESCRESIKMLEEEAVPVSGKFGLQYRRLAGTAALDGRIHAGAGYFSALVGKIVSIMEGVRPETDNKAVASILKERLEDLWYIMGMKRALLEHVLEKGFDVATYLSEKARLAASGASFVPKKRMSGVSDIKNPLIFGALMEWREQKAEEEGKRPSTILKRRSAIIISNTLPASLAELAETEGIGPKTMQSYGQEILEVISGA